MSDFIDFDPLTGISHWWDYDHHTDKESVVMEKLEKRYVSKYGIT